MNSDHHGFVSNTKRLWLFIERQDMKLTRFRLRMLEHRNRVSQAPLIAPGGPVVSLTTYGVRVEAVYLTIESIGTGTLLPSRIILWLQDEETFRKRPESLKRLENRGLEVCLTKSYGSHSKYFPYLLSLDHFSIPLVTADDDVLYSKWWLRGLADAHSTHPEMVNCYRARVMHLSDRAVRSYFDWTDCFTTQPSARNFATGVGGCIYPVAFQKELKQAGDEFLELCPQADDVWLHVNALRAGFMVRQISDQQVDFPEIPGSQASGLFQANIWQGRNDEQIHNTYTAKDIAALTNTKS